MCDTLTPPVWSDPFNEQRPRAISLDREPILSLLRLVNDIMVEDLTLAECLREATLSLWRESRQPESPEALRAMRHSESRLLPLLQLALRQGYTNVRQTEEVLILLRRLEHRKSARLRQRRQPLQLPPQLPPRLKAQRTQSNGSTT